MTDQLIPRAPKRKLQPTAENMREQLRLAADEIIRLRERRIDVTITSDTGRVLVKGEADRDAHFNPITGIVTFSGEFPPPRAPWWRRLLGLRIAGPNKPPFRCPGPPDGGGYQPIDDGQPMIPPGAE